MKDEYTIDINRRDVEFRQVRETLELVTNQLAEANRERENQHAKIKDLQADVEACHRTIAAGTRELEDAQSTVVRLTGKVEELTTELDALRYRNDELHTEIGRLTNRKVEELHAEITRLTGKVEELTTEVQMLRNLQGTDTALMRALAEDLEEARSQTQRAERRLDTLRDVFRDTVHVLIEKL